MVILIIVSISFAFASEFEESKLVDIGGRQLYIHCTGPKDATTPTVILEGGLGCSHALWTAVQRELGKSVTVCSYDRAGYGKSDHGPKPRTSTQIATELHTLLHKAGIKGPYILAGQSSGGIHIRVFNALYPSEVAGLILVESSHEDVVERMNNSISTWDWLKEKTRIFFSNNFKTLSHPIWRRENQSVPKPEAFTDEEWALVQLGSRSKYEHFVTMLDELNSFESSCLELKQMDRNLENKPLTVITREKFDPGEEKFMKVWTVCQKELLNLSSNSKQMIATKSGHMIPFEQPEIIVEAVQNMLKQLKKGN